MHVLETLFSKCSLQFQIVFKYRQNACFRDIVFKMFSAVPIRFKTVGMHPDPPPPPPTPLPRHHTGLQLLQLSFKVPSYASEIYLNQSVKSIIQYFQWVAI